MLPGKHARACAFQRKAKRGRRGTRDTNRRDPMGRGRGCHPERRGVDTRTASTPRTLQVQKRDETSQRSRAAFLNIQSPAHA